MTSYLSKGHTEPSDVEILNEWGIHMNAATTRRRTHCIWIPPTISQVKLNTDGAARGNPGPGGFGVSFRYHNGNFLYVMGGGLGNTTCYLAECTTIVEGVEAALSRGWNNLWVESDSSAAVTTANSLSMPWELLNIWKLCSRACASLRVTHTWREANQAADIIAKRASRLVNNEIIFCNGRPPWIYKWEVPYNLYVRHV
ncbi:hypothetical protein IFM89_008990 [Coptis chinensis]|uniref:RNase H type-1 domain-containing protein n=1 Tax=Coptis chinensis TaxID=261450 RepID=A0A835LVC2_9MAGN|nr:hypothetical protein IFM89_008990 [Coptis chinensis]